MGEGVGSDKFMSADLHSFIVVDHMLCSRHFAKHFSYKDSKTQVLSSDPDMEEFIIQWGVQAYKSVNWIQHAMCNDESGVEQFPGGTDI